MNLFHSIFLAFAFSFVSLAHAQFYKCVIDGKTTFTDQPCDSGSKSEVIKNIDTRSRSRSRSESEHGASGEKSSHQNSSSSVQRMENAAEAMRAERRKKEINREIEDKREQILNLQEVMDSEVAVLRHKKNYANNNLAGATWEESISNEIAAIVESYNSKIEVVQKDIDRLYRELDHL